MISPAHIVPEVSSYSSRTVQVLILSAVALCLALATGFYLFGRAPFALIVLAVPVGLVVICSPRLSLYLYLFCLFLPTVVIPQIPLLLVDVAAILVITAALFDVLLRDGLPHKFPPLTLAYALVVLALAIAGLMGYDPSRAIRPVARTFLLLVTFVAFYRLSGRVTSGQLLRAFFWICVGHSLISLGLVATGGAQRAFGISGVVFDELTMIALPIGVALFLWADSRLKSLWYLIGTGLVFVALAATQSRAPIGFAVLSGGLVYWLSYRRSRVERQKDVEAARIAATVRSRLRLGLLAGGAGILIAVLTIPSLFEAVIARFERLFTTTPGGTFYLRVHLWGTALKAFADHPLLGIGPGMYRHVQEIYSTLHLSPASLYVHGYSAHNMLLHFLAESGLAGAGAVLFLFVSQLRLAVRAVRDTIGQTRVGTDIALLTLSILLLVTACIEAGWLWGGQAGFLAAFLLATIARRHAEVDRAES